MSRVELTRANIVTGKRERKPTQTYWDQYVVESDPTVRGYDPNRATLKWLLSDKGYFADVPPEEVDAAISGSDFTSSEAEESDEDDGTASSYSSGYSSDLGDWEAAVHLPRPPEGVGSGEEADVVRPVASEP